MSGERFRVRLASARIRPQSPRLREPKQMVSLCYIYMLHRHNAKTDGFPFRLRTFSDAEIHTCKRKVDTLPFPNVVPQLFLNCTLLRMCARSSVGQGRGITVAPDGARTTGAPGSPENGLV